MRKDKILRQVEEDININIYVYISKILEATRRGKKKCKNEDESSRKEEELRMRTQKTDEEGNGPLVNK